MENVQLPPSSIWPHISKIAVIEDKPIMLDYWVDSLEKKVYIGLNEKENEKVLIRNTQEYTSPIVKIFKVDIVYIICTENSIYITSSDIQNKRIVV